jgi:hypothetical protein
MGHALVTTEEALAGCRPAMPVSVIATSRATAAGKPEMGTASGERRGLRDLTVSMSGS